MKCITSCCPLLPLHNSVAHVCVEVFFVFAVLILMVIISKCHKGCPPMQALDREQLFIAVHFVDSAQEPTTSASSSCVDTHSLMKRGLLSWLLHER